MEPDRSGKHAVEQVGGVGSHDYNGHKDVHLDLWLLALYVLAACFLWMGLIVGITQLLPLLVQLHPAAPMIALGITVVA